MKQDNVHAEKLFQEEIKSRLGNPAWDMTMARRVISVRRKRTRQFVVSSLSLAGISAAMIFAVMFVNGLGSHNTIYEQFITRQVEETFKAGGLSDTDVDQMIEETLALR